MNELVDTVPNLRGEFELIITDLKGNVVEHYIDKNLIVNLGKTALALLLGSISTGRQINKIAFGTSNIAPDVADTVITDSISKSIDSVSYPEFNSVAFAWTLDFAEGNGVAIAEFGLLSSDSTLFARKTRTAIAKDAGLKLTGSWKIIF